MVCYNSGLPEPPSQEEGVATNNDIIMANESESDDDMNEYNGYEPLSTNPDHEFEDENEIEEPYILENNLEPIIRAENMLMQELWSSKENVVDIEMDKEKEDMVKQAMLNFTLPASAIPDWAINIPEEQWKDHLMKRLENLKRDE